MAFCMAFISLLLTDNGLEAKEMASFNPNYFGIEHDLDFSGNIRSSKI